MAHFKLYISCVIFAINAEVVLGSEPSYKCLSEGIEHRKGFAFTNKCNHVTCSCRRKNISHQENEPLIKNMSCATPRMECPGPPIPENQLENMYTKANQQCCGETNYHQIKTSKNLLVLENLCLSNKDELNFTIEYNTKNGILAFFVIPDPGWNDTEIFHNLAFPDNMTCEEQMEFIGADSTKNQIVQLGSGSEIPKNGNASDSDTGTSGMHYYYYPLRRSFRMSKTKLWYLGVANCNSSEGLEFRYSQSTTEARENCSFGGRSVVSHGEWTVPVPSVQGISPASTSTSSARPNEEELVPISIISSGGSGGWNLFPSKVIITMLLLITASAMKLF